MTGPEEVRDGRRAVARVTPHELAFGEAGMEDRVFPRLEAAVARVGIDPACRDELVLLPELTELVRELVPPEAPPAALEEHRAVIFHAFNFWRFGKRLYLFEPAVVRLLVESSPQLTDWQFAPMHASMYMQLPANLFWASIAPDAPPEPVDGFFVTVARRADDSVQEVFLLDVLMVLGIRRRRAGFSVVAFQTEVGDGIPAEWCDEPSREGARDFEAVIPGGDLAGMYSILTAAEALKLVYRMLWYLTSFSSDLSFEEPSERRSAEREGSVRLSRLPFHRVALTNGEAEFR